MTELRTKQEKIQMLQKWIQYLGNGRKVVGIKKTNLNIKIQTKNFLVAYSIMFSSGLALLLIGIFWAWDGKILGLLVCAFLEVPFVLIGHFIQRNSLKTFEISPEGILKIDGTNFFNEQEYLKLGSTDYLKIYIKKVTEDNFGLYLRVIAGPSNVKLEVLEKLSYLHIVLETSTKQAKIGFANSNANKIFELLACFNFEE